MKTIVSILCLGWLCLQGSQAQSTTPTNDFHRWWQDRPYGPVYKGSQTNQLSLIRVQGNKFVDPDGKTILSAGCPSAIPTSSIIRGIGTRNILHR